MPSAPTPAPRLMLPVAILAIAIVAALIFASAYRQAPNTEPRPADEICGTTAPITGSHDHAREPIANEPMYYAGGLWSPKLGMSGLAELAVMALAPDADLLCQSLSWQSDQQQLIVIDVTPLGVTQTAPPTLAIISIDHAGGDIAPEFAVAIQNHLATLQDAKGVVIFTPLPGTDKRPKGEDPYDWTYLMTDDNIDLVDLAEVKPLEDINGRPHTGYLKAWMSNKAKGLTALSDKPTPELLEDYGIAEDPKQQAMLAWALASRSAYNVVPALYNWIKTADEAQQQANVFRALMLYRAMEVHADTFIAQAAASEDPAMRVLAARALADLAEVTTDPLGKLTPLAEDSDMDVRYEALVATRAMPGRRAAGIAQLVEPYEMTDAMRTVYAGTMAEHLTYGEPIQADSRANRLRRMAMPELLNEERDALVCTILLERTDLPDDKITGVLDQLAKAQDTTPLSALMDLLTKMNPRTLARREVLLRTLIAQDEKVLAAKTEALLQIATGDSPAKLQSAAAAAMLRARGIDAIQIIGIRPVLFEALDWIEAPALKQLLAPTITQTALTTTKAQLDARIAALNAFSKLSADSINNENVANLLALAREALDIELRFAAIRAINALPASIKPSDIDDLTLTVIEISAVPAQMKYDKDKLTITAGRPVELTLVNPDTMEHNLVITLPGRAQEIGIAMSADPAAAAAIDYVPKDSDAVLHYTTMTKPGASDTIRFFAPTKPGNYEYVCTFPGHYTSMRGVLEVIAP